MNQDELSAACITDNLGTSLIGRRVLYYPRLSSTMDTARREAGRGATEGTVIMAGEQTGGRGRMNRPWLSPRGNVALSLILYPEVSSLPYLIMVASLAVVKSIEAVTALETQIKWPNDILIHGKKVGGILIENEVRGNRVVSVIGIGINVGIEASALAGIPGTATSLNTELGERVAPVEVVRHLLVAIEPLYLALPGGGEAIYTAWRDRLVTLGRRVSVTWGGSVLEGVAESVDSHGVLVLRQDDGGYSRIVAGDVTLREK